MCSDSRDHDKLFSQKGTFLTLVEKEGRLNYGSEIEQYDTTCKLKNNMILHVRKLSKKYLFIYFFFYKLVQVTNV